MKWSLVVQGPMKKNLPSLMSLRMYEQRFDEIIVACYEGDEIHNDWNRHKVIRLKHINPTKNNRSNIYHQCRTTLAGTSQCSGEFVMKVRSDECFHDVKTVQDSQIRNPSKLVYIGKFSEKKIADHAFSMKKDTFLSAFEWIKQELEGPKIWDMSPERMFMFAFMKSISLNPFTMGKKERRKLITENMMPIWDSEVMPMIWSANGRYKLHLDYV